MNSKVFPTVEGDFQFAEEAPFSLTSGGSLSPVTLHYAIYGSLNARRDNAVLVCHALSGSARVADWWPDLFGAGRPVDLETFCVIGINVLGSCYGSTGPGTIPPGQQIPYNARFPVVSIGDMVRAEAQLIDFLGIRKLRAVLGGSIGGMQALQWAVDFPDRVSQCVAIGAAPLSAMGLAWNHLQRQAICSDPAWRGGNYPNSDPPRRGLALARALAMCTYKSPELFAGRFDRRPNRNGERPGESMEARFDIAGYLDYQGEIFTRRFDANSYLVLSKAMDTFDLRLGHSSQEAALERVTAPVHLIGISSDCLFSPESVKVLARQLAGSGVKIVYSELVSNHGHDAFLVEFDQLNRLIAPDFQENCDSERRIRNEQEMASGNPGSNGCCRPAVHPAIAESSAV